jgi:7-carboxy-7-deazaguanine synthase
MKISKLRKEPEIFASIQGEGRNLGLFSVFVRSSLCNLHCVWCDTDYTWNWQGTPFKHIRDFEPGYEKYDKASEIIEMIPSGIAQRVKALRAKNVVLTGGEPLLQQEAFVELMRILRETDKDYTFEVETNGTIVPSLDFDSIISQYNVSPKLTNSDNPTNTRIRDEALLSFAQSPKAWFKFVCGSPIDIDEVVEIVTKYGIKPTRVFLMPQGTTSELIRRTSQALVERCIEKGFNFTDRLHIHLFKNKRGT